MKNMKYTTDAKNAVRSLHKMHEYFSKQDINTKATVLLPKTMERGSEIHYRYLFYSCLLNYGMKSSVLHEGLKKLFENMPLLFSPQYICENYTDSYTELATILRSFVHVRYPNQCAKNWVALSNILHTKYNDNPKELLMAGNTYYDFQSAILGLKGFGQKTGGLLLRIMIDDGLLTPVDGIAEIPIDRHDIDLCVWLKVISNITSDEIKKNKKVIKLLSDTWVCAAKELSISPSIADQYLWIIGSQFCAKKQCEVCPLCDDCIKKGRSHEENLHCRTNVQSSRIKV